MFHRSLELPTLPATLEAIKQSVEGILAKLDKVNIPKIGETFLETLQGVSSIVNSDAIQNSTGAPIFKPRTESPK